MVVLVLMVIIVMVMVRVMSIMSLLVVAADVVFVMRDAIFRRGADACRCEEQMLLVITL